MPEKMFTFAWDARSNDFLSWLLPTLLVEMPRDERDALAEVTEKWRKVTLTMQINGVEVNPQRFLEGVERNMRYFAEAEAQRAVTEAVNIDLDDLHDTMQEAQRALLRTVRAKFAELGIDLPDDEY